MKEQKKITYTCVTYNRKKMLFNLLYSFALSNRYENYEWIIFEHDTTDGTANFLKKLESGNIPELDVMKNKVKVIYEDQDEYISSIEKLGYTFENPPVGFRKKHLCYQGKLRNQMRAIAQGDYFIDLPDDHQFLYDGNWAQDIIDIFDDRIEKTGRDDIGALTFRTRALYRILKKNNETYPAEATQSGVEYYITKEKTWDDWSAISRQNFERMGGYLQLETATEEEVKKYWLNEKKMFHYHSMLDKTSALGLKKIMTKIPIMHDCLDNKHVKANMFFPVFPIARDKEILNKIWSHIGEDRCMSRAELEAMWPKHSSNKGAASPRGIE